MQTQMELSDLLKEDGMNRAIAHADRVNSEWSDMALNMLKEFVTNLSVPFMCEDFRAYAEKNGLPPAPNKRAFGGIITKAKNLKWIEYFSKGETSNPTAHRAIANIWKSCLS